MTEPVDWRDDGQPYSTRYGDIYHSASGAPEQARHVFLDGCGLPSAWAGAAQWRILETGFGLGINFLTCWQAWRADPQRPGLLHFVSVEAHPAAPADLLRAARATNDPALAQLGSLLAAQWQGLLPGVHRLAFDDGRVLLTLAIGDVQQQLRALQRFDADSVFLDGFSPQRNPQMWSAFTLKAVARFARPGTRLATWTVARAVRDALAPLGFQLQMAPGLPPKRDCLRGVFAPAWALRRLTDGITNGERAGAPGDCAVIGAGLAGAAVAAQLALRGWRVTVLDAADHAAAGASGLPVGVLAPHVSPDDAMLSRLSRAGVRATWEQAQRLLRTGEDWQADGVLERRTPDALRLPPGWQAEGGGGGEGANESWVANDAQLALAGLPPCTPALWHARAGWVRPAPLVQAWLATPGVRFVGGARVAALVPDSGRWRLQDAWGTTLARADRVVIAAGFDSLALAPRLPLRPVRGQLAWGPMPAARNGLPPMPVNGDGHLVTAVPTADGPVWLSGATFAPDERDTAVRAADTETNRQRLAGLCPAAAQALQGQFADGAVQAWAGVRCASGDRRPLVGPAWPPDGVSTPTPTPFVPWVCTAMGSRGLSFAALCAQLLAARWHGEPLPLPAALAQALDTRRLWPGARSAN